MLYQLINYYTSDLRTTVGLWEYIGTTVVIFQNAAVLEVGPKASWLNTFSPNTVRLFFTDRPRGY